MTIDQVEVIDEVEHVRCAGCDRVLDDARVEVAGSWWHERCMLMEAFTTLVELQRAPRALLTARQVAERLGESQSSVIRRKAEIGYVRLRREGVADEDAPVRFRQEDVDRYILANFEPPAEGETVTRRRQRPRSAVVEQNPHLLPRAQRSAKG